MLARRSLDLAGPCGGALVLELSVRVCDGRALIAAVERLNRCDRVVVVVLWYWAPFCCHLRASPSRYSMRQSAEEDVYMRGTHAHARVGRDIPPRDCQRKRR